MGTLALLASLLVTGLLLAGTTPTGIAFFAAVGVGIGLAVSVALDLHSGGIRNLIRADLLSIVAFYFLTLFEFLFRPTRFDIVTDPASTIAAVHICLWGFGALAVGRHLSSTGEHSLSGILRRPVPRFWLLALFWSAMFLGFLHMLIAVHWNVLLVLEYWVEPRFAQPWQRGRLGDWKALLVELSMLLYLIPPLAGIILARRNNYTKFQLATVFVGLAVVLFYGFSSGTRNLFFSYLLTVLIGYAFALQGERKLELILLGGTCAAVMLVSTVFMLKFRDIGLRAYWKGEMPAAGFMEDPDRHMQVDLNLGTISQIVNVFPSKHDFLGWEVPYIALIRPIPRAIWKNKPEGLSSSLEDTAGSNGAWTVAASFVGEAYMAGGVMAVIAMGIAFGALMAWWNRLASPHNSQFGILIYASGFFTAVISMRSIFVFTTAMLPTLTAILLGAYFLGKREDQKDARTDHGGWPPRKG